MQVALRTRTTFGLNRELPTWASISINSNFFGLLVTTCKRQLKIVQNRQTKSVHPYLCFPFSFHFSLFSGGLPFLRSLSLCMTHPWCSALCSDAVSCPGWLMPWPGHPWPHPTHRRTCLRWILLSTFHTCTRQAGTGDSTLRDSAADNQSHRWSSADIWCIFWVMCSGYLSWTLYARPGDGGVPEALDIWLY